MPGWQLAPFQLLESTIRPKLSIIDEERDCSSGLIRLPPDDKSFDNTNDTLVRYLAFILSMCDIAMQLNTQLSLFIPCKLIGKYMFYHTRVLTQLGVKTL